MAQILPKTHALFTSIAKNSLAELLLNL